MGNNYYERRNIFSDEQLIECYLKHESQIKAAKELGCSRETVARAVRRAGIALIGRKNNKGGGMWTHRGNGGGGSPRKITDEELIVESKTMTRQQIAQKHQMNITNIDRKLHRLGIHCVRATVSPATFSQGVKRGGKYYGRIKAAGFGAEYDSKVTLARLIKRQKGICQICGKPVDKTDREGWKIGNNYPTLDHIIPIAMGGSHTWDNVQLAHMICNSIKGIQNAAEVS